MQNLIAAMEGEGFFPGPSIQADKKIHRFKRNAEDKGKAAWYIAFMNQTRKGENFFVCVYGDWRDGSKIDYCSLQNQTGEDKKYVADAIAESQKKRDAEQEKVWEETSKTVTELWATYEDSGLSPYLEKKRADSFGIKFHDGIICVPVRDEVGKLWSVQYIAPDGAKRFKSAGKVKGNFHLIGEIDSDEILVCEGYATGASLHQATGLPVLVCFNAGNMPEVCRKFSDNQLTVCADDDRFKDENAGRKYAALCPASRVIFPQFNSLDTKPTDFNDLHVLEGLSSVKEQIIKSDAERVFVLALGHRDTSYYYTSSGNRQIIKIDRSAHNRSSLRDLMPESYWAAQYPKKDGVDWDMAADALMQKCRLKGIFNDSLVRGVGVWKDKSKFLVNSGDSLFYGGSSHSMDSLKSEYIYEIGSKMETPTIEPLGNGDSADFIEIMRLVRWADKKSYKILSGWLVVASVGGALDWRPHIWLTGGKGSGKSYLMENIISRLLNKKCHYFRGQTTEAGIRQTIKSDSKSIIFDEFESEDEKGANRVAGNLELIRQASSESEGQVVKGSPSGQAIIYRPRFCALVSSIRVQLLHEADRSRFAVLDLAEGKAGEEDKFKKLKSLLRELPADYYDRLFSRTFKLLPVLRKNIDILWETLRKDYSARNSQQYSALLAGYWLLEHDTEISQEEADGLCGQFDFSESYDEKEHNECADYLMKKVERISAEHSNSDRSIGEMVLGTRGYWQENEDSNGSYIKILERIGLKVTADHLYVAKVHPSLTALFRGTKWSSGWAKSLSRIAEAEGNVIARLGGRPTRCVKVPLREIFKEEQEDVESPG